nr:response regulator [Bradyrhizobium aeschynomenes]
MPAIREAQSVAKILVVDDDPVMQLTIQRVLEHAGHAVGIAGDGQKALARFGSERFDLVVLDIFMPGMDGLEAMRMILKQTPGVPIIMTSGRSHAPNSVSEPDYLTMATKLGAVSALPKPFKPATLLAMVSDCLASAGKPSAPPRPGNDAVPNS